MTDPGTLKQRIHAREEIKVAFAKLDMSETELADRLAQDSYDLVHIDAQHTPLCEEELVRFCRMAVALGVPPQVRIRHTREAYLIGRYLDFGLLSVVVPQVESEATVDEAIEAFYYPPVGKRSWWPQFGYGHGPGIERREYADWWNANGILVLQLESLPEGAWGDEASVAQCHERPFLRRHRPVEHLLFLLAVFV